MDMNGVAVAAEIMKNTLLRVQAARNSAIVTIPDLKEVDSLVLTLNDYSFDMRLKFFSAIVAMWHRRDIWDIENLQELFGPCAIDTQTKEWLVYRTWTVQEPENTARLSLIKYHPERHSSEGELVRLQGPSHFMHNYVQALVINGGWEGYKPASVGSVYTVYLHKEAHLPHVPPQER